jgi:hypothetical protein
MDFVDVASGRLAGRQMRMRVIGTSEARAANGTEHGGRHLPSVLG